jgi:hypothetical protein
MGVNPIFVARKLPYGCAAQERLALKVACAPFVESIPVET